METCSAVLTFESVDEILWCDHSNETSSAVLWHGTICFSIFYKMKFQEFVLNFDFFLALLGVKGLTRRKYDQTSAMILPVGIHRTPFLRIHHSLVPVTHTTGTATIFIFFNFYRFTVCPPHKQSLCRVPSYNRNTTRATFCTSKIKHPLLGRGYVTIFTVTFKSLKTYLYQRKSKINGPVLFKITLLVCQVHK